MTSPATSVADHESVATERAATFRGLFALREYRALFTADLLSLLGDQVAAVAVAFLLFERSGSPLLAALGYASSYLPWLIGGPLLAAWAERLPSRRVLVGADLARAALIGLAALPGTPLALVAVLILLAAVFAPPFEATASSVVVQALPGDTYALGSSVRSSTHQVTQLVGFAAGGALVALVGAHLALGLNAVSFLCSALLIRWGVQSRPAEAGERVGARSLLRRTLEGGRPILSDPALRIPLTLGVVGAGMVIVPEAIATVYAASLGGGAGTVGLIMASTACGAAVGGLLMGRLVPPRLRVSIMGPLSLLAAVPLLAVALRPGLGLSLVLFALAGGLSAYQVLAQVAFGRAVPAGMRARVFSLAIATMYGGQAFAVLAAGAAASLVSPQAVIAGSAVLGVLLLLPTVRALRALAATATEDTATTTA